VLSTWRAAIGEAPLLQLQRELLAAVVTEHRDPALPTVEVGGDRESLIAIQRCLELLEAKAAVAAGEAGGP